MGPRWTSVLVGLSLLACGSPEPRKAEPTAPAPALAPLPVGVVGCDALIGGGRCLWGGAEPIRLWLAGEWAADALSSRFDGEPLSPDHVKLEADHEGVLLEVMPPRPRGRLSLAHTDGRRFELEVAPESTAYLAAREELVDIAKQQPLGVVRRRLAELRATLEPVDAHRLDALETALAYPEDADLVVRAPWRLDQTPPELADVVALDDAHFQAFYFSVHVALDYDQAVAHLRALRAHPVHAYATVAADYWTGVLEQRVGRTDEALEWFRRAARLARRLRLTDLLVSVMGQQAVALVELGMLEEADVVLRQAEGLLGSDDPLTVQIRNNMAWALLLAREDDPTVQDPTPMLRELAAYWDRHPEDDPPRAAGVRLNLALALGQNGSVEEAARVLETVDRKLLPERDQVFVELVKGQVAAARGRSAAARDHLERARLLAELGGHDALVLRVLLARAELEQRAGESAAARAGYAAAEAIESELAQGIAPMVGRSAYSSARRRSRARHVELLLEQGDRAAALCTVLGARARHLRSLAAAGDRSHAEPERRQRLFRYEQRREALERRHAASWELPADQLSRLHARSARELEELDALLAEVVAIAERARSPWRCDDVRPTAPDHGLLTMHPTVEGDGWWFLLDRQGAVEVRRVPAVERGGNEAIAAQALVELQQDGHLQGLHLLTVVPVGEQVSTDFHALEPLRRDGGPRVRYGLGLGSKHTVARTDATVAVIVGAAGNLREPRAEASEVRAALAGAGWRPSDAWTPGQEPQPALLHYAGHGNHGGPSGWGSDLRLASGALTSKQVVAHQRAPAVVVLGACEAGTSDAKLIDGGMSMASAFLLAGAELVIAPTSTVADDDARALARALYSSPPTPGDSRVLAEALEEALAAAQRAEGRFSDWRAWVP